MHTEINIMECQKLNRRAHEEVVIFIEKIFFKKDKLDNVGKFNSIEFPNLMTSIQPVSASPELRDWQNEG